MIRIPIKSKKYPGKVALIDDMDLDIVSRFDWFVNLNNRTFYALGQLKHANRKEWPMIYMHRLIMNPPVDMQIDHIDHDGLNNQRNNLRICTASQNQGNKISMIGSSRFKGVSYCSRDEKWRAQIKLKYIPISLGYYSSEEGAAMAYDRAAIKRFGEFARTNKEMLKLQSKGF